MPQIASSKKRYSSDNNSSQSEGQASSLGLSQTLHIASLESGKVAEDEIRSQKDTLLKEYQKFNSFKNREIEYLENDIAIRMRREEISNGAHFNHPKLTELRELSNKEFEAYEYTNTVHLNSARNQLEMLRSTHFDINPYDPGELGKDAALLSTALMQHDLAVLIGSDLSLRDTDSLEKIYQLLGKHTLISAEQEKVQDSKKKGNALSDISGLTSNGSRGTKDSHNPQEVAALLQEAASLIETYHINTTKTLTDSYSNPDFLEKIGERAEQGHNAFRINDVDGLENHFNAVITPLLTSSWARNNEAERLLLLHALRGTRTESFEKFGYSFTRSSSVLSPEGERLLSLDEAGLKQLTASEQARAIELQRTFWDTKIPWHGAAEAEIDIRLANTSYATLKRASGLISALETKLIEVDNSNEDTASQVYQRKEAVERFWSRFQETKGLIEIEGAKALNVALENNTELASMITTQEGRNALYSMVSHIAEDAQSNTEMSAGEKGLYVFCKNALNHLIAVGEMDVTDSSARTSSDISLLVDTLKPFYALQQAVSSIPEGQEVAAYSEAEFADAYQSLRKTAWIANHSFKQIKNFLDQAQAGPKDVENLLSRFKQENLLHPEREAIHKWSNYFKPRYREIFELYGP